jgi:glutamate 5-kinase
LLVILSVVDGLFDGDPSAPGAQPIPLIERWDDSLLNSLAPTRSSRGTGGMQSKLSAVRMATAVGENVIIAGGPNHDRPGAASELHRGGPHTTPHRMHE